MLTHILGHIFWMRTWRILLVDVVGVTFGVCLGHFHVSLHQTRTQYCNKRPQHCNCPIFKHRFLTLSFVAKKTVICQFRPSKQQHLLLADWSIAMTSHSVLVSLPRLPLLHINRATCYIVHQFQGQRSRSQAHIVCTSHLCLFLIWGNRITHECVNNIDQTMVTFWKWLNFDVDPNPYVHLGSVFHFP